MGHKWLWRLRGNVAWLEHWQALGGCSVECMSCWDLHVDTSSGISEEPPAFASERLISPFDARYTKSGSVEAETKSRGD